jgi:hypothetical protein
MSDIEELKRQIEAERKQNAELEQLLHLKTKENEEYKE